MTTRDKLDRLTGLKEQAKAGGRAERMPQQHAKGKLTARERINLLLAPGSFEALDPLLRNTEIFHGNEVAY